MDLATLCKAFFTLGTAVNIGGTLIPSFRQHIMNYGSRRSDTSPSKADGPKNQITELFDFVGSFQVPHTWFIHYYLVSVASSIFWAVQILCKGRVFEFFPSYSQQSTSGMTVNQVFLAWLFMMLQGTRRLYECITLTKPSQSKMWIGIWLIGIVYYLVIGISIWIEGINALQASDLASCLKVSKPSMKTFISVPIFILASGIQHDCHEYLASLKKYTLPKNSMFQLVVCPHYTSECFVYVAIAIVSAPKGHIINQTVLAGLIFVVSNLAVTADSTRKWYVEKFGAEKLQGRMRMVPYIF